MKNANLVSRCAAALVGLLAFGLVACGGAKERAATPPAPKTVADFFAINVGPKTVRMQLAVLDPEMERGLMERRDLGADDGMLFVYAKPQRMNFWMHDTPTPLDIGFFDPAGVLREVYPMQPFDERTVSSRSTAIQFCLEMNQGWYSKNEIRPGVQLDFKALAAAMKARGFDPKKYGLE